jgi:hypothetical protein
MLPDKRTVSGSSAIAFKTSTGASGDRNAGWHTFELTKPELVEDAILLLERAYEESVLCPYSD